jgi:RND family efflux transporter MFP subunit
MSMRRSWLIGSLIAALVASGVTIVLMGKGIVPGLSKKNDADKPAPTLEFLGSEVVRPTLAQMSSVIEFSGPLVAPGTALVRTKAAGTLLRLDVAEGSRVRAGQMLGQVDLEELRQRLAERTASVESARAQLEQAQHQHRANEGLAAQSFIAPTALELSKAALESARAQWLAAQAQLEGARLGLRNAALVAPISGVVARRHALPGEKLATEQQVLTIVDLSHLELAGLVGTHEVSQLRPGMSARVQVEGNDDWTDASIVRIAPAAETGTRSIGVSLTVANPNERFRAGQFASAKVSLEDQQSRLTVPIAALGNTGGQDYVWLIDKGVLARRIVTTGRSDPGKGRVEVLRGLAPDAQVLAMRFDNLREGAKAELVATRSAVASAASSSAVR